MSLILDGTAGAIQATIINAVVLEK